MKNVNPGPFLMLLFAFFVVALNPVRAQKNEIRHSEFSLQPVAIEDTLARPMQDKANGDLTIVKVIINFNGAVPWGVVRLWAVGGGILQEAVISGVTEYTFFEYAGITINATVTTQTGLMGTSAPAITRVGPPLGVFVTVGIN